MKQVAIRMLTAAITLLFGAGTALSPLMTHDAMSASACMNTDGSDFCSGGNTAGPYKATTSVPQTDTPAQAQTACYNAMVAANSLVSTCTANGGTLTWNGVYSPETFFTPSSITAIVMMCSGTFTCT